MNSPRNKYLLALSGGVDSCVLFDLLIKNKYDFYVVHFNHNTRGEENIIEQNYVSHICEINNIPCFIESYQHIAGNFQSKARAYRISKYKEIIKKYHLNGVILGHHLDDNFENLNIFKDKYFNLMQKISYSDGLKIYRPLINNTKKEIYKYASDNKIIYFEDSSNKKLKYIRNNVRNNSLIVPDKDKKQIISKALSEQKKLAKIKCGNTIYKDEFINHAYKEFLIWIFIRSEKDCKNVKKSMVESIVKSIDFNGNKTFTITKNIYLIQEYDKIYIKKNKCENYLFDKKVIKIGINEYNGITFENNIENVFVRTRKEGDKFIKNGHTKKVARYMIDKKISASIRDIYPIVVNEMDEVLYIPKLIKK